MNTKPKGSAVVLVLWILFCWPVAIIYAIIRDWSMDPVQTYETHEEVQEPTEVKKATKAKGDK